MGARAQVRLIPRLRVYLTRGNEDEDVSRIRPPAKLFKPEEITSFGGEVESISRGGALANWLPAV